MFKTINDVNDSAYTLHLDLPTKRKGRFKKGNIPWNKGITWAEQGVSKEIWEKKISTLQANRHKNGYSHKPTHSKPVIQLDEDGNRLHWYESSEAAARKNNCKGRNIRKVCDGERKHAGGFRWKWDENFI